MRWTAYAALAALLLAGCASDPPPPDPSPCITSGSAPVITDTETGIADPVRVEVRVVDARTDEPLPGRPVQADLRPHKSGQYGTSLNPYLFCLAAMTTSDAQGVAVLNLAAGKTYQIAHPLEPNPNLTDDMPGNVRAIEQWKHLWTAEVLTNVTVERGMAPLVLPLYPGYANFTWTGIIRGLDPNGNSPVEVQFPLFSTDPAREQEFLRRMHKVNNLNNSWLDEVTLRWTNTLTTWADLVVNVRVGDNFVTVAPEDKTQGPGDGPQEERLCTYGPKDCLLDPTELRKALTEGIHVVAYNTGALVAPDGLPLTVTVQAWFTGPYEPQAG